MSYNNPPALSLIDESVKERGVVEAVLTELTELGTLGLLNLYGNDQSVTLRNDDTEKTYTATGSDLKEAITRAAKYANNE